MSAFAQASEGNINSRAAGGGGKSFKRGEIVCSLHSLLANKIFACLQRKQKPEVTGLLLHTNSIFHKNWKIKISLVFSAFRFLPSDIMT